MRIYSALRAIASVRCGCKRTSRETLLAKTVPRSLSIRPRRNRSGEAIRAYYPPDGGPGRPFRLLHRPAYASTATPTAATGLSERRARYAQCNAAEFSYKHLLYQVSRFEAKSWLLDVPAKYSAERSTSVTSLFTGIGFARVRLRWKAGSGRICCPTAALLCLAAADDAH